MSGPLDVDDYIGRRLRLRDLRVFFAVAQCGSMAKAAALLGVSQPAVSQVMADLEQALNVRLLDRTRRGVELTLFGTILLKHARAAFDDLRQGVKEIEHSLDPTAGELRIGCPESLSTGFVVPVVELLSIRYPRLRLHVQHAITPSTDAPQLANRDVDLLLARLWPPATARDFKGSVAAEVLFNDGISLAVDMQHPLARRRKVDLAELTDERWIATPPESPGQRVLANAFRARGLEPPKIALTTYSVSLRTSLASTGRYVAAMPTSVLRLNAKSLPLKELPIDLGMPPWPVAVVTPRDRSLNPAVPLFLECAREVAKSLGGSL
jgi:DNA-binding transcriptional LysR family regulator